MNIVDSWQKIWRVFIKQFVKPSGIVLVFETHIPEKHYKRTFVENWPEPSTSIGQKYPFEVVHKISKGRLALLGLNQQEWAGIELLESGEALLNDAWGFFSNDADVG